MRHKECGYRLRDNVHFHMYISTSPCGDGRLNSPYEITTDRKTPVLSAALQKAIFNTHNFHVMYSLSFALSSHSLSQSLRFIEMIFSGRYPESHCSTFFFSLDTVKKPASFSCHIPSLASFSHAVLTR